MTRQASYLVAGLLGMGLALPHQAAAEASFFFTQTSSSPSGLFASFDLTLSDKAYRDGVNISLELPSPHGLRGTGIIGFDVEGTDTGGGHLSDFVENPETDPFPFWFISLASGQFGVPTGEIIFDNSGDDWGFDIKLGAQTGTITWSVDDSNFCFLAPCVATGTWDGGGPITFAPEPASLALLLAGGLGLVMVRRSR